MKVSSAYKSLGIRCNRSDSDAKNPLTHAKTCELMGELSN